MLNHLLLIVILYLIITQMILSFSSDEKIEISSTKKELSKVQLIIIPSIDILLLNLRIEQ